MITLQEEIKIANQQIIKFESYTLKKERDGSVSSRIRFYIYNETGDQIRPITIDLSGQEHNDFWDAFSTGSSIYELLANKNGWNFTASQEVENEFIN